MLSCLFLRFYIFLTLITVPHLATAESDLWQVDGKLELAAWSSNRSLNKINEGIFPATLALKGKVNVTDDLHLYADGRVGHPDYFADKNSFGVAREVYLDYNLNSADIRIGKQLLAWGRADRINPTDSLTSKDYRWLAPEEEDARFGNTGIRYAQHLGNYTVSSVWLPYMSSSRIPLTPQYVSQVAIQQPNNNDNFAIKLDRTGEAIDSSLSFYSGIDTMPSLEINSTTPYALSNHRIQRYGGDMAWAFSSYTLRTELAYTHTGKSTEFSGEKYDYFQGVIGLERQFANSFNVIVQTVYQSALGWRGYQSWSTPQQQQLMQIQQIINQQPVQDYFGIAYRVSKKILNDDLELEYSGLGLTSNQGFLMRPRLRYQINDESSFVLGGDYYNGSDNTIFGRLRDISTVFVEFNYAFGLSSSKF